MRYVLEVIKFITLKEGENGWVNSTGGKNLHIGYMKARFKTKEEAVLYYDMHNPHMRSLNANNTYKSGLDPTTKLLYIVRDDYLLYATVDKF